MEQRRDGKGGLQARAEDRGPEDEAAFGRGAQMQLILDASLDRICRLDMNMRVVWANKTVLKDSDLSLENVVGRKCYQVFFASDEPCDNCPTIKAMETGRIERAVVRKSNIKGVPGESCWDIYVVPLTRKNKEVKGFIQVSRNITDEMNLMEELKKSRTFFKDVSYSIGDWIWEFDRDGKYTYASEHVKKLLGYEPEEMIGRPAWDGFRRNDDLKKAFKKALSKKLPIVNIENWCLSKNGKEICLLTNGVPICDEHGEIAGYRGVDKDITALKLAERHVRSLNHEMLKAQENERQMIARELHDTIGQELVGLKFNLETLPVNWPELSKEAKERIRVCCRTLSAIITSMRNLAYDLRPPGLNNIGVINTISGYCEDFSERTGLRVEFSTSGEEDPALDYDTKINLYRLVQEGLNNINKHAAALHVTVRLEMSCPDIILHIEDDGRGFDVKKRMEAISKEKRMGLRSMEERVRLLGGKIKVTSRIGRGTRLRIRVPHQNGVTTSARGSEGLIMTGSR